MGDVPRALRIAIGACAANVSRVFGVRLQKALQKSAIGRLIAIDPRERRR